MLRSSRHRKPFAIWLVGRKCPLIWLAGWSALVACSGCEAPASPVQEEVPPPQKSRIIAQGQILPAKGIIRLSSAPGDVVEEVLVQVGDKVNPDQPLVRMRSEKVTQANLNTLRRRREEAVRQQSSAIESAERQVAAAQLKLEHIEAQRVALKRKNELLTLAEQQVLASRAIVTKLESIATNSVTSEFVGQLEIDRQRISLSESELNFRQHAETQLQAEDDLQWGLRAAQAELAAANSLLETAQSSLPLEILDLEIKALAEQAAASQIIAPTQGVILAVNAAAGESSLPLPLIEMADIEQLVCEIEINEMDAALVEPGQSATIVSRALRDPLRGTVSQKFKLVGRPQLRTLDPLARADYRTVTATVKLDDASVAIAKDWLQLQVEVTIETTPKKSP